MSNYQEYQKKGRDQGGSRYPNRPQGDPYSKRETRNPDRKYSDNQNSYKGYNTGSYNDNYQSKGPRNYNQAPYKAKPHYPRNTYEEKHDVSQYRRKVIRYQKNELLSAFEDRSQMPYLNEFVTNHEAIFIFNGQDPVNDEEFHLDPNEAFAPPRSIEPNPKKEEIVSDNKFQLYDIGSQNYDPIAGNLRFFE